ncbi:hypothetical protein B0H19DRAFT_1086181 [Mycena capillaripes]|nr:hypothetical protein B0H19DRAFT_1086181 [Mycena capillaripes]
MCAAPRMIFGHIRSRRSQKYQDLRLGSTQKIPGQGAMKLGEQNPAKMNRTSRARKVGRLHGTEHLVSQWKWFKNNLAECERTCQERAVGICRLGVNSAEARASRNAIKANVERGEEAGQFESAIVVLRILWRWGGIVTGTVEAVDVAPLPKTARPHNHLRGTLKMWKGQDGLKRIEWAKSAPFMTVLTIQLQEISAIGAYFRHNWKLFSLL